MNSLSFLRIHEEFTINSLLIESTFSRFHFEILRIHYLFHEINMNSLSVSRFYIFEKLRTVPKKILSGTDFFVPKSVPRTVPGSSPDQNPYHVPDRKKSEPKIRTTYQNPYRFGFSVRYGRPWPKIFVF